MYVTWLMKFRHFEIVEKQQAFFHTRINFSSILQFYARLPRCRNLRVTFKKVSEKRETINDKVLSIMQNDRERKITERISERSSARSPLEPSRHLRVDGVYSSRCSLYLQKEKVHQFSSPRIAKRLIPRQAE